MLQASNQYSLTCPKHARGNSGQKVHWSEERTGNEQKFPEKKIEEKFPPSARLSIRLLRAANNSLTFFGQSCDKQAAGRLQSGCVTPACTLWDPRRASGGREYCPQVGSGSSYFPTTPGDGIILRRHTSRGESTQ